MLTLNNVATTDAYQDNGATLPYTASAQKIIYLVANNPVICQVKPRTKSQSEPPWSPEFIITPQVAEFDSATAIRFRSAISGKAAQVIAQLIEPGDPIPVGGTPFTASLSPTGTVTPSNVPAFTTSSWAGGPPATPADGDIWIATDVDASGTRWMFQYNSSGGTYKWDFIGGPPVYSTTNVADAGSAGAWVGDARTAYSVVRSGDYLVLYHGVIQNQSGVAGEVDLSAGISAADAAAGFTVFMANITSSGFAELMIQKLLSGVAAGATIEGYWFGATRADMTRRALSVIPRRIA